jgi:putative nucleotidyltransferase with HDIG domain
MSLHPSLAEHEVLADTFSRVSKRLTPRELLATVLFNGGFFAMSAAVWLAHPPHGLQLLPTAVCLLVLVVSMFVRLDTPYGFTVPTQLAFVPLLFAVPLALVPVAVCSGFVIARLPEVARGEMRASRLVRATGNAWFALGPVVVFVAAGVEPQRAGAGVLIAALAAQFVFDFAVSSLRDVLERGATITEQLKETWVYAVDIGLSFVALLVARDIPDSPVAALAVIPLLALFGVFARERHQRLRGIVELGNAYRGTALVLGDVVEADDGYTGQHCKSVVALALEVAEQLGLSADQRRNLEFGALLHDVGKIAIPKEIINKPGQLDPHEWTIVKTHTLEGQKMLERVGGFMRDVGLIVRSHHERWDGGGYPDGLAGQEIPLEARIISCCDTWNAMRTDRSYRKALPHEVAVAEMLAASGSQLDPDLVRVVLEMVGEAEEPETTEEPGAVREQAAVLPLPGPATP